MINRWSLIAVLMLSVGGAANAQPGPKVLVWNQRTPQAEACYGIVGEVERPGVYSSTAAQVTLQELIERAGGLSRRGSSSVRIIHGGRGGQSVFYLPRGRDVLPPGTLVVIDAVRDPKQPLSPPVSDRADRSVWIAMIGLTDRPEVVSVNPEQAQLPNIMLMLGQSAELAKAVQTILPPRLPESVSLTDPLPNGAVLVFERRLLVTDTLPAFPAAIAMTAPAPATTAVAAAPPATTATPVSDAPIASLPRTQVDAQTVPFIVPRTDEVPANPASLPAPGSRFSSPSSIIIPPSAPMVSALPAMTAGPPLIVETDPQLDAEIVGVPAAAPPSTSPARLDPWQLLGIMGSIASLVGVSLVSRRYLVRQTTDATALPAAIAERLNRTPPLPPRRSVEPAITDSVREPSNDLGDNELRELLSGRMAIESEPIELPSRLEMRSAKSKRHSEPAFRLDDAETPTPHFPLGTPFDKQTTFFTDAAADAAPVPAPHFRHESRSRTRKSSGLESEDRSLTTSATEVPSAMTPAPLAAGTSLERALSQLQKGLKS
jgi:hypothetical protein